MQPLTASELHGVWATVLLPLADDDSIDFGRLELVLDRLLASPVHGVYTNGTAGEFHTLTEAEYDRLHELVASRCSAAGMPFQLGASHPGGQLSLDRIARAAKAAPAAIQVVLPDWLPLDTTEVLSAIERMADVADGVPLVLYNPPYAKTRLDPAHFQLLADRVPTLIGVKVPGGDDRWYESMGELMRTRLAVFVAGHTLASGYRRGAVGSYSNVACLSPDGAARWYRQMTEDLPAALELESRLRDFLDTHIAPLAAAGYSDPALDKTLAAIGGWAPVGTRVRWPHNWIADAAIPGLRAEALRAVPELLGEQASR